MNLWNLFWEVATVWAAPLIALLLCLRAVISRDGRARRLAAVAAAFLPAFVPLFSRLWVRWTDAAAGNRDTYFLEASQIAPAVPAIYLLAWAFRSTDQRWMRTGSAILGLVGLCFPLMFGWRQIAASALSTN